MEINTAQEGVRALKAKWEQDGPGPCTTAFARINQALAQINAGVEVDVVDLPTWNPFPNQLTNPQGPVWGPEGPM